MEGGQWGCRSYYKVVAFKTAFFLFESVVDGKIVFDLARYDILGSEFGALGQVWVDGGRAKAAVPFGRLKEPAFGARRQIVEADDG